MYDGVDCGWHHYLPDTTSCAASWLDIDLPIVVQYGCIAECISHPMFWHGLLSLGVQIYDFLRYSLLWL